MSGQDAYSHNLRGPLGRLHELWSELGSAPVDYETAAEYARSMHSRPLDYFVSRVRMLGLQGDVVLDAGCGTGTWSFALRHVFDSVIGIDINQERLVIARWIRDRAGVEGVRFRESSILATGLPDESVDVVFAYSVLLSAIPIDAALTEFRRVLRPGGTLYVCLNGPGWSRYVVGEKGRNDPQIAERGRSGIYNSIVATIPGDEISAVRSVMNGSDGGSRTKVMRLVAPGRGWEYLLGNALRLGARLNSRFAPLLAAQYVHWWCRRIQPQPGKFAALKIAADSVKGELDPRWLVRFGIDVWKLARDGTAQFSHADAGRDYAPDEVEIRCSQAGFVDFQWAAEGHLLGVASWKPVPPLYPADYRGQLMIWEFFAFKPDSGLGATLDPEWFVRNALDSATRSYVAKARPPFFTNVDSSTVPRGFIEEARRRAQVAGPSLIPELAVKLCADSHTDEDCAAQLVRFVQRALIHHPVVQPFEFNGTAETDPATLLFLGLGRCGSAAELLANLCVNVGLTARVERVPGHVFVLAQIYGRERVLDANYFTAGTLLLGSDDSLMTYQELLESPRVADALPDASTWWRNRLEDATDIWGRKPYGYISSDTRIYSSLFEASHLGSWKPRRPIVRCARVGTKLRVTWSDATPVDGNAVDYLVRARDRSRGWDYGNGLDAPDHGILMQPQAVVHEAFTQEGTTDIAWTRDVWIDVTPRLVARPDVFCWPSDEVFVSRTP